MEIRNNTFNPNFQAIIVPKNCQRRFMAALRDAYPSNNESLLKCVQTLEKELPNKNHIKLYDVGYCCGEACNGHLRANVNGNEYWNSDTFLFWPQTPDKFMKKLSDKAGKSLDKKTKLERKAQDYLNKAEILEKRQWLKEGKINTAEQRNYLLGRIYELINYKPKV